VNPKFARTVECLELSFQKLMQQTPVRPDTLPSALPRRGMYLFSDGGSDLYVGRTNNLKGRIQSQCRRSSSHNQATLAFRIARKETGRTQASYTTSGSRDDLESDPGFGPVFSRAKDRIRKMDLRFVEEEGPTRQALLEICVATVLETPYNDFENH